MYSTTINLDIKYIDVNPGSINENIFVKKINHVWKIILIDSLDRYVNFRVGQYKVTIMDFMKPLNRA